MKIKKIRGMFLHFHWVMLADYLEEQLQKNEI